MIRKINFSNFYSFEKKQEISFLAKKKTSYSYTNTYTNDQITKVAAFVGGNASGKTNVMRLFSFLSYFVCMSSKDDSVLKNNIAFKTFFNNKKSSEFNLEYEDGERIFYYHLIIKNNIVLKENLSFKETKKNAKKKNVFIRDKDSLKFLNKDLFKKFPKEFIKNIRFDVSLIAFLKSHYNIEIINNVFEYFAKFKTNINEFGQILHHLPNDQIKTLEMYLSDNELKREIENLLASFDTGLLGFNIEKNKNVISVTGQHETNADNKELDFIYESSGTKALFFVLGNIINAIRNNSVIVIDELEFGLHPEALIKLISYIIDENENHKAQVIFSSHSLGLMNKLDMHQIYLTDKGKNGNSDVYRLNKVEGVRSDENFLNKYMSGAYGGFPNIKV